ncbi:hypothetical protein [Nostoc sp.]|uniref:hypothetical protein n=1 Tax=Nostoc sp. TaxID=1180 RepID=UPI002FF58CB8
MKFLIKLGVVKAKIHHDLIGKLRTVTISQMPGGRYYASLLIDDEAEKIPSSNALFLTETLRAARSPLAQPVVEKGTGDARDARSPLASPFGR